MKTKFWLYVAIWILILVIFSSDFFSYFATRRLMFTVLPALDPDITKRTVLKIHEFARKGFHVINYSILSWLLLCAWTKSFRPISKWTPRFAMLVLACCLMFSMADELRQSFSDVRTPRILDIFLDMTGATLIQLFCWLMVKFKQPSQLNLFK